MESRAPPHFPDGRHISDCQKKGWKFPKYRNFLNNLYNRNYILMKYENPQRFFIKIKKKSQAK